MGDGWATVTGKFDSIDSIVGPIRCRCLRLVGWAWTSKSDVICVVSRLPDRARFFEDIIFRAAAPKMCCPSLDAAPVKYCRPSRH